MIGGAGVAPVRALAHCTVSPLVRLDPRTGFRVARGAAARAGGCDVHAASGIGAHTGRLDGACGERALRDE